MEKRVDSSTRLLKTNSETQRNEQYEFERYILVSEEECLRSDVRYLGFDGHLISQNIFLQRIKSNN